MEMRVAIVVLGLCLGECLLDKLSVNWGSLLDEKVMIW